MLAHSGNGCGQGLLDLGGETVRGGVFTTQDGDVIAGSSGHSLVP